MTLSMDEKNFLIESIRDIPDFPKPGIVFKDITTLLADKKAYGMLMKHLCDRYGAYNLTHVAGIDARGFIFGAALAQMLGTGFVPIRKKGKLPYTTVSEKYSLEYGVDEVEIHIDAFAGSESPKVLPPDRRPDRDGGDRLRRCQPHQQGRGRMCRSLLYHGA